MRGGSGYRKRLDGLGGSVLALDSCGKIASSAKERVATIAFVIEVG